MSMKMFSCFYQCPTEKLDFHLYRVHSKITSSPSDKEELFVGKLQKCFSVYWWWTNDCILYKKKRLGWDGMKEPNGVRTEVQTVQQTNSPHSTVVGKYPSSASSWLYTCTEHCHNAVFLQSGEQQSSPSSHPPLLTKFSCTTYVLLCRHHCGGAVRAAQLLLVVWSLLFAAQGSITNRHCSRMLEKQKQNWKNRRLDHLWK